jgi:hypothetical protein
MDGARFMEIMDSIDMSAFSKDDKVYQFATNAKTIMQKIANNETLTPKMLEEITQMMDIGEVVNEVDGRGDQKPGPVKGKGKGRKKAMKQVNEEKIAVKEYVDGMVASYLTKIGECQDAYLGLVVEIDKSTKEEDSAKTRSLGKMAKASFNKLYEYNTICQNYSNISSYLRGMIKNRGLK